MSPLPVSVQLYSVRDAVAADLPAALDRLAHIGFTQVEPYGFAERAGEFAAGLGAAGLSAPSGHVGLLALDDPRPAFEAARTLGMTTVIDPFHDPEQWASTDAVARTAERLSALAGAAREFGLTVGYHNHAFELENRPGGTPALEVLARELSDDVVLEVDTFWAEVGGVSAPALLQRLGGRVRFIHVKDGPISRDTSTQLPAGRGAVDVPAVLAAAPQAQRVLEFDAYAGDVFDGLAQSLEFVTAHEA